MGRVAQDREWAPLPTGPPDASGFVERHIDTSSGELLRTGSYLWHTAVCETGLPPPAPGQPAVGRLIELVRFGLRDQATGELIEEGPQFEIDGPLGPVDAIVELEVIRTPGGRVTIGVEDLDTGQDWAKSSPTSSDVVTFQRRNLTLAAGQTVRLAMRVLDGAELLRVDSWQLELRER